MLGRKLISFPPLLLIFFKSHWQLALQALIFANLAAILEVITTALVLPLTQVLGNNPIAIPYANQSRLIKQSLDFYNAFSIQQQLLFILLGLLSFAILKNINFYAANISINKFMLKGGVFIRQSCIERFLELEMPFYTKTALGEILSYVNEQAQRSERLFSFYLEMAREIISLFFLFSFLIVLSPTLTLVTVGSLGVVVILLQAVIKKVSINGQQSAYAIERFSSLITEILSGMRVIKSFGAESLELRQAERVITQRYQAEMGAYKFLSAVAPLTESSGIAILLLIILLGTMLTPLSGSLALSLLLTYTLTLLRTLPKINQLNNLRSNISLNSSSLKQIQNFLDSTQDSELPNGSKVYETFNAELKLENVTFTFPNSSEPVLKNLNLQVKKGMTTAIVGSSGSGKSTTVDLIMRFYDPDRGSIEIDGTNVRELQMRSWRKAIAIVSQDTFLFNTSIRENIVYGRPDATDKEIEAAIRKAYLEDFIQTLPNGLDTVVGNRGTRLSGGQRQRLAIARALLCDPDILILDEATSALDSKSEQIVQKAIEEISGDRTVIVIAHRLSTIQKADKIVVMDNGEIVESGTHAELINLKGMYHSLYKAQNLGTLDKISSSIVN